jgi:hypothetical protein
MKLLNRIVALALATGSLVMSTSALADMRISSASNPAWKAECGSCHLAYPPSLLPADAWRAVMAGLDKHFGADASVDAKTAAEIGAFLEQHAGRSRGKTSKPNLRITETAWFQHEHDEVGAAVWRSPKVKTPANCAACHRGAEQGNFDEHDIRLPK